MSADLFLKFVGKSQKSAADKVCVIVGWHLFCRFCCCCCACFNFSAADIFEQYNKIYTQTLSRARVHTICFGWNMFCCPIFRLFDWMFVLFVDFSVWYSEWLFDHIAKDRESSSVLSFCFSAKQNNKIIKIPSVQYNTNAVSDNKMGKQRREKDSSPHRDQCEHWTISMHCFVMHLGCADMSFP